MKKKVTGWISWQLHNEAQETVAPSWNCWSCKPQNAVHKDREWRRAVLANTIPRWLALPEELVRTIENLWWCKTAPNSTKNISKYYGFSWKYEKEFKYLDFQNLLWFNKKRHSNVAYLWVYVDQIVVNKLTLFEIIDRLHEDLKRCALCVEL